MKNLIGPKKLLAISICSMSIQYGTTVQLIHTSSLYGFLGVDNDLLPYLWLIAPLAGLCTQPLVGHLSDPKASGISNRRPYLIFFSLITGCVLLLFPFSISVIMLSILVALFYIGINGCGIILKAWVGDITPATQMAKVYSLETITSGFGSFIAGIMPWVLHKIFAQIKYNFFTPLPIIISFVISALVLSIGGLWSATFIYQNVKKIKATSNEMLHSLNNFRQFLSDFPAIIIQLSYSQFFVWAGLFLTWIYLPLAFAQHIYGLALDANISNDAYNKNLLNKGIELAGICFGIYQLTCMIFSFLLSSMIKRIEKKTLYSISLILGGIGFIGSMYFQKEELIFISMIAVGLMISCNTIIPIILITNEAPAHKMGICLGMFNVLVTLPQILSGVILGPSISWLFTNNASYIIIFSGTLIVIGGVISLIQISHSCNRSNL